GPAASRSGRPRGPQPLRHAEEQPVPRAHRQPHRGYRVRDTARAFERGAREADRAVGAGSRQPRRADSVYRREIAEVLAMSATTARSAEPAGSPPRGDAPAPLRPEGRD